MVNTESAYSKQQNVILITGSQSHLNPRREIQSGFGTYDNTMAHICFVISVLWSFFFNQRDETEENLNQVFVSEKIRDFIFRSCTQGKLILGPKIITLVFLCDITL